MADNGKFDALSKKVKEHAANASANAADNASTGRLGNASKPTTVGSAAAKPTAENASGGKGILSSIFKPKTDSDSSKPTATSSATKPTATTGTVKPTTTTGTVKPAATTGTVKPAATTGTVKPATTGSVSKPANANAAAATTSTKFTDVPSNAYYAEAVAWAVGKGIVSGTTETTFTPNNPCHRGHAATFIWRSQGSPAPKTTKNPFTDVSDGPFYKAILWASENNIVPGITATTFDTQAPCTRAQVLTYLMRAFSKADAKETDAIKWAATKRLLAGMDGNASSPCSRADMVTFLYRVQSK